MFGALLGARDVNSFRNSIKYNHKPDVSSMTYEGLINEYYFDVQSNIKNENNNDNEGKNDDEKKSDQIIIPTYNYAKSKVPLPLLTAKAINSTNKNNETNILNSYYEHFMTVGLVENFDVNSMKRQPLNLVITLDISGSMNGSFSYDKNNSQIKMEVAKQSLISLLKHLNDDDRLGIITFNSQAQIIQKMEYVKDIDINQLKQNISKINAGGGTDMEVAFSKALTLYDELPWKYATPNSDNEIKQKRDALKKGDMVYISVNNSWIKGEIKEIKMDSNDEEWFNVVYKYYGEIMLKQIQRESDELKPVMNVDNGVGSEYSNRIIFLTDAVPNNSYKKNDIINMVKVSGTNENSMFYGDVYTTFIGVGIDFNTKLIEKVTKVKGGNYLSVHSNDEFKKTMDDEFIFLVSPIVFDFKLILKAEGNALCIKRAWGTGNDEKQNELLLKNGELMNVETMFPSKHDENDKIQGGLVLLKLKTDNNEGKIDYNMELNVSYTDLNKKLYKAKHDIILNKQNIQFDDINNNNNNNNNDDGKIEGNDEDNSYYDNEGIRKGILLMRYVDLLRSWMTDNGQNNKKYKQVFEEMKIYFKDEMKMIKDDKLNKELIIFDKIIEYLNKEINKKSPQ